MGKAFWTQARDKIIREVATAKESARTAAEWIGNGCTRNMVISHAKLMKPPVRFDAAPCNARITHKRMGAAKKSLTPIFNRPAVRRPVQAEAGHEQPQPQQTPIPQNHALVPCEGKTIVDLGPGECRYPLGPIFDVPRRPDYPPRLFCAQECGEKVYCEPHMRLCTAAPQSRMRYHRPMERM
jgi:hypothetical protein